VVVAASTVYIVCESQKDNNKQPTDTILYIRGVERIKERMVEGGKLFYDRVIRGLTEIGIDTADPIELSLALRKIGARKMEELFGVGEKDGTIPGGRRPVITTEIFHHTLAVAEKTKEDIAEKNLRRKAGGKRVLLLSTDVHEYAKIVIGIALEEAGVEVVDIGHSIDPDQAVKALQKTRVDGICISTHNGMALTYAKNMLEELRRNNLEVPVFMGGRLNELSGETLPRDVTADLKKLKIIPCHDIFDILGNLH